MTRIEGKVAKVISERDLVINRGSVAGVEPGMRFKIVAPEPSEIRDPDTDEVLGAVDITKVEVEAVTVEENLSVCRTFRKVRVPGKPRKQGVLSPYPFLTESIFGDSGTPDTERFETLRSDESFVANELAPESSYVKSGDRAVQF